MERTKVTFRGKQLPVIVQKGEDGFYVVECPILDGCYTQGKTLDEALKNIREVIDLVFTHPFRKRNHKNPRKTWIL